MITLSNKHSFQYVTASGALGFDGRGWWWEKPLVASGFIDLSLFTIVLRTLTLEPRLYPVSNLSWIRPWTWLPWSSLSCVQFLPDGGVVNKVGLWNPGFDYWETEIAPWIKFDKLSLVASIQGGRVGLVDMARRLNRFTKLKGIEVNVSCPNTGHKDATQKVIEGVRAVKEVSSHPVWLKLGADQMGSFRQIADGVCGYIEAFDLNSVPYARVFENKDPQNSPVAKIGKPGSGAGGVSGKPAQEKNWEAVRELVLFGHGIPVIAPSVMEYEDLARVRALGAKAVSFGAIHCKTPWKPTTLVRRERREKIKPFVRR